MDDLSLLEIVNLLSVGLSSFNFKQTVASDIPIHNQVVKNTNLRSQDWLDQINAWTKEQKMKINAKKSSVMIFNYTRDYQFATRLSWNNESLEIASHKKLLGTIISNDLSWDLNTAALVKKANLRLQLLRKVASFGTSLDDLKEIYILFVRSILEHSAPVWHSSLSVENSEDLERVQNRR